MNDPLRIEQIGVGTIGLIAIGLACYSTAARYFFPIAAPDWGEEVVVYLSVWALWLAAGSLARRDAHVRAEFFVHILSDRMKIRLQLLHAALGILFTAAMVYGGLRVVLMSLDTGERSASTLAIPLFIYYAGMPVGMSLMLCAYLMRLRRALQQLSGSAHETE